MKVSIIGAGSWGSAVAWLLGNKGFEVALWARSAELAENINATHCNSYLAGVELPASVVASNSLAEVLKETEAIVFATPSVAVGEMAQNISTLVNPSTPLVLLSKGIESSTRTLLLDVLERKLGSADRLAVLSGPNHAEEVARGILSGTVIASRSLETAEFFQKLFATPAFRVYTSQDTVGVQLCGAAKNIIAIACGLSSGLGLGDNTAAMLMTRGLAEISRLVIQLGGSSITCMGLAGMGDLIVTCTSPHSRNRTFGLELARGESLENYQARTHMVVEGALACKAVTELAQAYDVEMPISEVIRSIIWEQENIKNAIPSLMERSFKPEFY